jgi:hypothetical protein
VLLLKVTYKSNLYRPAQFLWVPGSRGSQISRQSAYEGGKVVSCKNRPLLPSRKYSWYSCLLEVESTTELPFCVDMNLDLLFGNGMLGKIFTHRRGKSKGVGWGGENYTTTSFIGCMFYGILLW